jgi:2'-5' RNA ligase
MAKIFGDIIQMEKIYALVIKDYYIGGFIKYIQTILSDLPITTPPHITIRGPVIHDLSHDKIKSIEKIINQLSLITISTIDYFYIEDNIFTVYISVLNNELKKITRKRDYPMYQFGFNPHITICKTSNIDKVDRVKSIFNGNNLELTIENKYLQLQSFEIGRRYQEFDFGEYATREELISKDRFFKKFISLTQDIAEYDLQYRLF